MHAEKYENVENMIVIGSDSQKEEKAIIVKEKNLNNKNKLSEQLKREGMEIDQAREKVLTKYLADKLEFKAEKLKEYFRDNHMSNEAEKVDKLSYKEPSRNLKKISNEIQFFGQSFLEGFLSFFGFQLDNAVKEYEHRIHIIEQIDLNNNHKKRYYLGTIQDNDLKLADKDNPLMTKNDAEQELRKFSKPEKELNLSETLQRKEDKDNEN